MLLLTVVLEFKQLVQVSPPSTLQAKGEDVVAVIICPPFPAKSPPKVVEPVPPLATVRALSKLRVLICAVLEAVIAPKYGDEEALKV